MCNCLDEYALGSHKTVSLARDREPSKKQLDEGPVDFNDRKVVGYGAFYESMFSLIKKMKTSYRDTYEAYQEMTAAWIVEAR